MSKITRRIGVRKLAELRALLSPREKQILKTLGSYQVASTGQIRRLYFTGHKNQRAASWSATHSLRELRNLGVIDSLPRRIGGWHQGSAEAVWYLTAAGLKLVRDGVEQNIKSRLAHSPSLHSLEHRLATVEVWVRLSELVANQVLEEVSALSEPGCWRQFSGGFGNHIYLKPDLSITTIKTGSEFEDIYFIEIDRGTESLTTIRRKIEVYESYRRSGIEQTQEGIFPHVIWIVPDKTRQGAIASLIRSMTKSVQTIHSSLTLEDFISSFNEKGGGL